MRILSAIFIFSVLISYASAQNFFTIDNIHLPDNEYFTDIQYSNSRYYALSTITEKNEPYRTLNTLFIFDESGHLIGNTQVGEYDEQYFRIVSIDHNKIKLIGTIKTDSCSSILTLSEYNFYTNTLTRLAQYNLCEEKHIHSIRIVPGLDDKTFFEAVYSPDELDQSEFDHRTLFFELDTNSIHIIPDLQDHQSHISIDFSEKGYVVRWGFVCEYYDRNFNHRYQYNNNTSGFEPELNSYIQPLVNHYLLEHILFKDEDHRISEEIRLIDSNLYTKRLAIIDPQPNSYGVRIPLYGGIAIGSYNCLWATANFGNQNNPISNYFSITRLDSDLKIVCDHFVGFDAIYKIIGITAFEDNGAIVYGYKMPYGSDESSGDKDLFAMKVGNDCELLTTATNGPQSTIPSISAYPNPGINDLTFSINGFDPTTLRVELTDESGRVLFTKKDLTNYIQVPEFPAGQYYYRILQKDRLLGTGSWVKQ